jgi:small subunit ribosomal protein S14
MDFCNHSLSELFNSYIYFENIMAKKSMIERDKKRQSLAQKYYDRRQQLKKQIKEASSLEERFMLHRELQSLPRNSAPNRIQRRCFVTGRPKAVYRDFGLSRHVLREMAHACLLPGVTKSSW